MKYYQIREVRKNARAETMPPEPSIQRTIPTDYESERIGEQVVWMNEEQKKAVKRAGIYERCVLWLYRWSQVMFWVGLVLALTEMALVVSDAVIDNFTIAEWQKTILYFIGSVGFIMFFFGAYIDRSIERIDESSKKKSAPREQTGERVPSE